MAPHQDVLGFIYPGRQVSRPAKIWMKLFHQIAMRPGDIGGRRALLQPENFISFIFRNRASATRAALMLTRAESPRVMVRIACRTPAGKPAIKIRF